jgi:hypothetical protein
MALGIRYERKILQAGETSNAHWPCTLDARCICSLVSVDWRSWATTQSFLNAKAAIKHVYDYEQLALSFIFSETMKPDSPHDALCYPYQRHRHDFQCPGTVSMLETGTSAQSCTPGPAHRSRYTSSRPAA